MNYILFGDQYPIIKKKVKRIIAERLEEPDDFNVSNFDFAEDDINDVLDSCYSLPLGVDRKVVVIDNAKFLIKGDKNEEALSKFTKLFEEQSDEIDIVLIARSSDVNEKLDIFKFAKENGQVVSCSNLTPEEWPVYIKKYFTDRGVIIDYDAVAELNERIDGNLMRFLNEGAKLCLYKDHLTLEDIKLFVAKPISKSPDNESGSIYKGDDQKIYALSNALFRKDKQEAIEIYRELQLVGSKYIDFIIPMLGNSFRFMFQCLYLNKKGYSSSEIAEELKVKEGRVKANLGNARRCNIKASEVLSILEELHTLDAKIKSGQIDRFYGFELFLLNF